MSVSLTDKFGNKGYLSNRQIFINGKSVLFQGKWLKFYKGSDGRFYAEADNQYKYVYGAKAKVRPGFHSWQSKGKVIQTKPSKVNTISGVKEQNGTSAILPASQKTNFGGTLFFGDKSEIFKIVSLIIVVIGTVVIFVKTKFKKRRRR